MTRCQPEKKSTTTTSDDGTSSTSTTMTLLLFDRAGNPISAGTQAVVGGTPNIATVQLELSATNTGQLPLFISPGSSLPAALATALPTTEKTIAAGSSSTWLSTEIDADQLVVDECPGMGCDITFSTIVSAAYCNPAVTASCSRISLASQNPTLTQNFQRDVCADGTIKGTCSLTLPLYCDNTLNLVNKCSICGCPIDYYGNAGTCEVSESCTPQTYTTEFTSEFGGGAPSTTPFMPGDITGGTTTITSVAYISFRYYDVLNLGWIAASPPSYNDQLKSTPGLNILRLFTYNFASPTSEGNTVSITSDIGPLTIYLPALTTAQSYLYVADDGSTYYDQALTNLARAAP